MTAVEKRVGRKGLIPMVIGVLLLGSAGAQQLSAQSVSQVNERERGACRQDVRRFCQAELQRNPDDMLSITGCLQANRTKISRVCRNALARNGQ
jgi:predicted LPLAT superfamily acyltransferase